MALVMHATQADGRRYLANGQRMGRGLGISQPVGGSLGGPPGYCSGDVRAKAILEEGLVHPGTGDSLA